MYPLAICLWLVDSLRGVQYTHVIREAEGGCLCARVYIQQADKPLFLLVEGQLPGESWGVWQRVAIDRWSLPREVKVCTGSPKGGTKVRFRLVGPTPAAGQAILYEGFPWGPPPRPPEIHVVTEANPPLLRLLLGEGGTYLVRGYNRFGEEVFSLPIQESQAAEVTYVWPALKGQFLLQVYDVQSRKVVTEKSVRL